MAAQCPNCGSYVTKTYICKNCQTAFCIECMQRSGAGQLWHDYGRREVAKFKGVGAELGLTQLFGLIQSIVASKPCPSCGMDNAWASKPTRWVFAMITVGALFFFIGLASGFEIVRYIGVFFFLAAFVIGIWPMLTKQLHAQRALNLAIKSGELGLAIEAGYEYQKAKNMGAEPSRRDIAWILKKTGATMQQYDTVVRDMAAKAGSKSSSDPTPEHGTDVAPIEDTEVEIPTRLQDRQDIPPLAVDSGANPGESNESSKQSPNLEMMGQGNSNIASLDSKKNKVSGKSRLVVLLLCLFFGVFGIHRFYVGKKITGILQLVTLGGLFIWVLLDLLTILFGRFSDSKGSIIKSWR